MEHRDTIPSPRRLPAEWEEQDAVLLAWPHPETDWRDTLDDVCRCYRTIAQEIISRERLILIGDAAQEAFGTFAPEWQKQTTILDCSINDTWTRDYAPLTVETPQGYEMVDFGFNAWGLKFAAQYDNLVGRQLMQSPIPAEGVMHGNYQSFIFEGGSIESNGMGWGLTTSSCLWEANRNPSWSMSEIVEYVKKTLGLDALFVLNHGSIPGDDTDGHIDTLARFIGSHTIAYVAPTDPSSQAYPSLIQMEQELQQLAQEHNIGLVPLPDVGDFVGNDGTLIPATYANFLFVNGALLLPIYHRDTDLLAIEALQKALPERVVCPIDCRALIQQHGSLHCITMQYPKNSLR